MLLTIAHGSPLAVGKGIDARVVVFGTMLCEAVFNWAFEVPARTAATAAKVAAERMMSAKVTPQKEYCAII
jgi:hypothetical protein